MQDSTRTEHFLGPHRDECVHALRAADHAYHLVREIIAGKRPDTENLIALIGELERLDDVVFSLITVAAEEGGFGLRSVELKEHWPKEKDQPIQIKVYGPPFKA